jgi:hypothetical protein
VAERDAKLKKIAALVFLAVCVLGSFAWYKALIHTTQQKKIAQTVAALREVRSGLEWFRGENGAFPRDPRVLPTSILPAFPTLNLPNVIPTTDVEYYDDKICQAKGKLQIGNPLDTSQLRHSGKWGYVADPTSACNGMFFIDAKSTDEKNSPYSRL